MPSLSSPAEMTLDVLQPASVERTRELEPSPPTTVISLAPAAAYQTAAQADPAQPNSQQGPLAAVTTGTPTIQSAQLTFATGPGTYDLTGNTQYVHVCFYSLNFFFSPKKFSFPAALRKKSDPSFSFLNQIVKSNHKIENFDR